LASDKPCLEEKEKKTMFTNGLYDPLGSLLDRYDPLRRLSPLLGPGGVPFYGPACTCGLPAPGATRFDSTPYYNPYGQPIDRFGNLCDGAPLSGGLW
jgi:hypothetical protein